MHFIFHIRFSSLSAREVTLKNPKGQISSKIVETFIVCFIIYIHNCELIIL